MSSDVNPASGFDLSEFGDPNVRAFLNRRCTEVSEASVEGDMTPLRQYTSIIDGKPVEEAEYSDVVEYADVLATRGVTKGTLEGYISSISMLHDFLNQFKGENMPDVSKIPQRYSNLASVPKRKPIEPEEVRRLIDEADTLRESLIIAFTYFEGLRASETAEIKLRHLRMEDERVEIKYSKNGKSRTLALHSDLEFMLELWLNEVRPSHVGSDSDYLFVGEKSVSIDNQDVWQIVHDAADAAGIQRVIGERADGRPIYRVKPHVLRHSFATHAFDNGEGMEIEDISIFLGHNDTRPTEEYIHHYTEQGANESFDQNFDPF